MDRLREMETFVSVAECESFTQAARRLGVTRSTVTKIVAGLEARVGIRLLTRSTHHVAVTGAGQLFAAEARKILADIEALNQALGGEQSEMTGDIRMGAPPSFAAFHLLPALMSFRSKYPNVRFDVPFDDGSVNLVREGLDFSIRIAPILPDTALVARLLVKVPQVVVASAAYLERNDTPRTPEDLEGHNCLIHTIKAPVRIWTFDEDRAVRVGGSVSSSLGEVLHGAALAGEGISMHPTYMVSHDLQSGRLVRLLPGFRPEVMSIYAVYAERRFRPQRVLSFIDFLKSWLGEQADWFID